MLKWIGAFLIVASCGSCGFLLAGRYKKEERDLRQLVRALDYMQCELQFRLTPLPLLCRQAGREVTGCVREILTAAAGELDRQFSPDAGSCFRVAMEGQSLPGRLEEGLVLLGFNLGRFDLEGQVKGLESVRSFCRSQLEDMGSHRDQRLRSYQTLGLCAGAALAILLV